MFAKGIQFHILAIFEIVELLGEAIFGLCLAEEQGLQEILQSWTSFKPSMEKLKIQ